MRTPPASPARPLPPIPARGRIMLLPGLRRVWRGEREVQLGTDPRRAIVICLPDRAVAGVFDLLNGGWTERGVQAEAARRGLPAAATAAFLATLRDAGVLVRADALLPPALPEPARRRLISEATSLALGRRPPADALIAAHARAIAATTPATRTDPTASPSDDSSIGTGASDDAAGREPGPDGAATGGGAPPADIPDGPPSGRTSGPGRGRWDTPAESMRRRAETSVRVVGLAWLVTPIAAALARAGIGHVYPVLTGRVIGSDDTPGGLLPADEHRPRANAAADAVRRAAPYADTRAVPLARTSFVVLVGQRTPPRLAAAAYARRRQPHLLVEVRDDTVVVGPLVPPGTGPCLNCVDLHRRDRDPAWPAVAAQLATPVVEVATAGVAATLAGIGVAVAQVLAYVDGAPVAACGASLEIGPDALLRRRAWPTHPGCDCRRTMRTPGAHGAGRSVRSEPDEVQ